MADSLILTGRLRPCRRCSAPTWWATTAQLDGRTGLCLDHADGHPCPDRPDERAALRLLLSTFSGCAHVDGPERPVRPRTDQTWVWVRAGVRWRSCGCLGAGQLHGKDPQ